MRRVRKEKMHEETESRNIRLGKGKFNFNVLENLEVQENKPPFSAVLQVPACQMGTNLQIALTPYVSQAGPFSGFQGSYKRITVPSEKAGMIIGTGGKNIRRFENISGARIHVVDKCLRPYPETREVDLTGTPQQVSRAEQLIKAYTPQDAMVSKNFSCNSPSRHAERFIMVDGFKVKEKYAELYRAIKAENGDIRRPSILDASEMAVVWLISDILLIVHAMCQMPMLHVTLDVFEDWNIKICLAEHLGYNVAWLREHYENLKKEFERNRISDTRVSDLEVEDDSSESLDQVISLFELRVEDAKENLSVLQSESDAICAWVEKEKQEKDGVRHLSLLNGVFRFLNCLLSSKICFFCVLVVAMFMMLP